MSRLAVIVSAILVALPLAAAEAAPRRIVSLNLCADQYLIVLADKEQIAALTNFARDPGLSYLSEAAKAYPYTTGAAEAIVAKKPDLIIGNPYGRAEVAALLKQFAFETVDVPPALTFEEIVAQTRRIAALIGHPERGEALVARMRAELARIPPPPPGRHPVAVHYQRRGFVTGTETLLNEMMTRAGLENLAGRIGDKSLAHVSLERIVVADPDYLIFTTGLTDVRDQGLELLTHPVLARQFGQGRILTVPENLTVCGGPFYPIAVATLARQLRKANP